LGIYGSAVGTNKWHEVTNGSVGTGNYKRCGLVRGGEAGEQEKSAKEKKKTQGSGGTDTERRRRMSFLVGGTREK